MMIRSLLVNRCIVARCIIVLGFLEDSFSALYSLVEFSRVLFELCGNTVRDFVGNMESALIEFRSLYREFRVCVE